MARKYSGIQLTGRYGFAEKVSVGLMVEKSKRVAVNTAYRLYSDLNRLSEELWDWKALVSEVDGEDKVFAQQIVERFETDVLMLEKRIEQVERSIRL